MTSEPGLTGELGPIPAGSAPLRIDVVGGGPVGLFFSYALCAAMGSQVHIRIYDRRWREQGKRIAWLDGLEGNFRREQVVTLQSNVWTAMPQELKERLFSEGHYSEMWPFGPDSPDDRGRPRNVRIRWVEDCLLELVQDVGQIELCPGSYTPPASWGDTQILVISDGAHSSTRNAFTANFGAPDQNFYSTDGEHLIEKVLGIWVKTRFPDEYTVPLTVSQNRFLYNSLGGGFINMRLTAEESWEVMAIDQNGPVGCIQHHNCMMLADGNSFICRRHRSTFKPAMDRLSFLWPRVQDGMRFFGVRPQDILGINMFRLGMTHNSRFTAQLAPSTFGFLLGDAANALHFWPGRGLNTGLKGALSLVHVLRSHWRGKKLRASDFSFHEGTMQQLQYREKSRAWTTMLMPDENGNPRNIEQRLRDGLKGPCDRPELVAEMLGRIRASKSRLSGRMGRLPDDQWYLNRIYGLHNKTLKTLVETGPWITLEVGGDEVSVEFGN